MQPPCVLGQEGSALRVVMFGDSHAAQWQGALAKAVETAGWEGRLWTKSGCPSAKVQVWYPPRKVIFDECGIWRSSVMERLTQGIRPDLVILANSVNYSGWLVDSGSGQILKGENAREELLAGLRVTIERLLEADIPVAILHDTPTLYRDYRTCLTVTGSSCARPRQDALEGFEDESSLAREFAGRVSFLDLNHRLCDDVECPAVIGGEIVYRDDNHLTHSVASTFWEPFLTLLENARK